MNAEDYGYGPGDDPSFYPGDASAYYHDPSVMNHPMGGFNFYSQDQEHQWDTGDPSGIMAAPEPGFLAPVASLQAHFAPAPVGALAFNDAYAALHMASAARPLGTRRTDHRAAMLVAQSMGGGAVYSTVAGHPQAPAPVLNAVYDAVFGASTTTAGTVGAAAASSAAPGRGVPTRPHRASPAVPAHAYRPYFGATDPAAFDPGQPFQLGIHTLLGLPQGYVASVSPAGVRLHTTGGLQVTDRHLEGMICGAAHPNSVATHLTVGGLPLGGDATPVNPSGNKINSTGNKYHLLCLDIWSDMRTVASHSLNGPGGRSDSCEAAVTAIAASAAHGSLLVGGSDGQLRMFDASLRRLANIKGHAGGISAVAVSQDGTLIATTGFGARSQRISSGPVYAYPDPSVLVYDIRYLGRGGISHPFDGVRGGPRHIVFLPDINGMAAGRLLVASGQSGGGMQIIEPFQAPSHNPASFILPPLERDMITAISMDEADLALGTSSGKVIQYHLGGCHSSLKTKQALVAPPYEPIPPALNLGPELLQRGDLNNHFGTDDKTKSIFSAFILNRDPVVSLIGDPTEKDRTSFGDLAANPLVAPSFLQVSSQLLAKSSQTDGFIQTVKAVDLQTDLLEDHRPKEVSGRVISKRPPQPNPNKLMYTAKLFPLTYSDSLNRTKKMGRKGRKEGSIEETQRVRIPDRYRLTLRLTHKTPGSINHSSYNNTGYLPGWDYAATMPNAFVPPILMLLYFIPESRKIVANSLAGIANTGRHRDQKNVLPELGFVFARIEDIARLAFIFPANFGGSISSQIGAWAPTNFISCLTKLPEAEQLQILDGSPAAVDPLRRPEAFFRFLLYHIDKEAGRDSSTQPSSRTRLDDLFGATFVSINEFISGSDPPSQSESRQMTIDLFYDNFLGANRDTKQLPSFADVLQRTLFRETRLRAWSSGSKAYETIVQRKIMTTLPKVLSLSCCCTGRDPDEGLCLWRTLTEGRAFLPEYIEIELEESGALVVREKTRNERTGEESWIESKHHVSLPGSISSIISERYKQNSASRKQRYRLEVVLSNVRDDLDQSNLDIAEFIGEGPFGHQVIHARVPMWRKMQILEEQCLALKNLIQSKIQCDATVLNVHESNEKLNERLQVARKRLAECQDSAAADEWVVINGFVVCSTTGDDARDFRFAYREPSLILFRAIENEAETDTANVELMSSQMPKSLTSVEVMDTVSISNGRRSIFVNLSPQQQPVAGDLLAFDAEFVAVGEEESIITETGSKLIVREMRYAVARISVMNCRTKTIIVDDYVLPLEPVTDYLTRFSGVVAKDIDSSASPHHLISTRAAYLKLRYLVERGCVFLGHGLPTDFWTLNLTVPANQVVDTVEIYHKPAQRYVSLRFLANFVLRRDMQRDVHDSVEDALTAYQLYEKALELKAQGTFEQLLDDLYEFGVKCDWKLGVDDSG